MLPQANTIHHPPNFDYGPVLTWVAHPLRSKGWGFSLRILATLT